MYVRTVNVHTCMVFNFLSECFCVTLLIKFLMSYTFSSRETEQAETMLAEADPNAAFQPDKPLRGVIVDLNASQSSSRLWGLFVFSSS